MLAPSFHLVGLDGTSIPSPLKSLWLEYYANAGALPDDSRTAAPPPIDSSSSSFVRSAGWQAPQKPTESARLWAVLRDDHGGLNWLEQRVIVRLPH